MTSPPSLSHTQKNYWTTDGVTRWAELLLPKKKKIQLCKAQARPAGATTVGCKKTKRERGGLAVNAPL